MHAMNKPHPRWFSASLLVVATFAAEPAIARGVPQSIGAAMLPPSKPAQSPGTAQKSAAAPAKPAVAAEPALRAELKNWKTTPYLENGTTRKGVDNDAFARALLKNALAIDIPANRDDQFRTGKQIEKENLAPGDLVFFETGGLFKSKYVGVFLGKGDVAIALKDAGVTIVRLSDDRWGPMFKTGRHISTDPHATAPTFNAAEYGSNREALLRDIAKAWKGTLYLENGKTFNGIGNDEFVREVYGAINETELPGTPRMWATMGKGVKKPALEPGDIVIYQPPGIGKLFNQRAAGLYIGDGEFVHALKSSAVTISKIDEQKWQSSIIAYRRIDPDALEKAQETHAAAARGVPAPARPPAAAAKPATAAPNYVMTDREQKLRDAIEPWRGTPYKIGGTTKKGIDCSAFVREIYNEVFKTELPRTAEDQESLGGKVDRAHLQSGDLVFFRTQGMGPFFKSRQVGLYLGGVDFAQASGKLGVTITRLDNDYWSKKYEGARRMTVK